MFATALAVIAVTGRYPRAARGGDAPPPVTVAQDGNLVYRADERGNRVPDFSNCGYEGADREIPRVPVRMTVAPGDGDDGARIQLALDQVAQLPVGDDGFRGAVLLLPGRFDLAGQLSMTASGVVLRGAGALEGGATIVATGTDRRCLIRAGGTDRAEPKLGQPVSLADTHVPVGSTHLRLGDAHGLRAGQSVQLPNRISEDLISTLGMEVFGVGWRPAWVTWDRRIAAVKGDVVVLDAPITMAIGTDFQTDLEPVQIIPCQRPERIENLGIEDVALESDYHREHPHDEEHAWHGVVMNHVENAWVRRVTFRHFAGGAVLLREGTARVTVEDCASLAPVSELGGYRRQAFFTQGQLTLFLRCWSEQGLHEFCVGNMAPGPNAFVNCRTERSLGDTGPLERWATGVLYDCVRIDGAGLNLQNRWSDPPGTGWSAANCLLWNCRAATMRVERPPTATNWAVGVWADFAGDGEFSGRSDFASPLSLYEAQLAERLGKDVAAKRVGPILGAPVGATNPTLEDAKRFVAESSRPARRLIDDIVESMKRGAEAARDDGKEASPPGAARLESESAKPASGATAEPLRVENGWLTVGGRVVTGDRFSPTWWRGNIRPDDARNFGPAITRFAPGREGMGLTDDLRQVADFLSANGYAAYDHHYGLWYDRRRDDHLMERRADGAVAPPFFEQPFARTGEGRAWDGLSKYDLTKPNPWYWSRLHDFARLCDERGLVLLHQNYFQHNILEAGAHWADCPWRPANNVNDTGLPEPPPLIGDKRIFMAPAFYDPANAKLRALHRGYIRQCLDALADSSNVVQMTSAENSGPLEFMQFWLDTIGEWEDEHQHSVLVGLSAPKDVQDAILADSARAKRVDVIDIRYWAYTAGDGLYAPAGGQNLAPRQHLRMTRQKSGGAAAISKAVKEYRTRYPDKAVTYYADENCPSRRDGWGVLMGGGSLAGVRLSEELSESIRHMSPIDGIAENGLCLAHGIQEYLVESQDGDDQRVQAKLPAGRYRLTWIDKKSGEEFHGGELDGGEVGLAGENAVAWLRRIE